MYRFATTLIAGIVAAVLGSSVSFMPTPAQAAKLSKAERVALEKATAACKTEAKGMKFSWHWRKRQKYVQNCIIRSASKAGIDIWEVRSRANLGSLPIQELDDLTFVFSRPHPVTIRSLEHLERPATRDLRVNSTRPNHSRRQLAFAMSALHPLRPICCTPAKRRLVPIGDISSN